MVADAGPKAGWLARWVRRDVAATGGQPADVDDWLPEPELSEWERMSEDDQPTA